jgi:hypothetical protein
VQVVTVVLLLFVVILGLGTSRTDVASGGLAQTGGCRTNSAAPGGETDSVVGAAEGEGDEDGEGGCGAVEEITGDGSGEAAPNGRPWDGLAPNPKPRNKTARPASPSASTAVKMATNADLRAVEGGSGGE